MHALSPGVWHLLHNTFKAQVFNAAAEGVVANGGASNDYGGSSTDNCKAYGGPAGQCSGFHAIAGTSNFTWDGRAGGLSGLGTNSNTYGVVVDPGPSNGYIIRGDLSGNVVGSLSDGGTGTRKDFSGVISAQPWLPYTSTIGATGGTSTTATGAMQYRVAGTTVTFTMTFSEGSTDAGSGALTFGLPFAPVGKVGFVALANTTPAALTSYANNGASSGSIQTATGGYPGAANASFTVSGSYQIAPQ